METLSEHRMQMRDPLPVARRKLSWGAIVGGVFTTLAVNILMMYFGSALGLSIFTARDVSQGNLAIPWAALGWMALTAIVSGFMGAWVAGRWSNVWNRGDAILHGALTWSVAAVALALAGGGLMHLSAMATSTNELATSAKPADTAAAAKPAAAPAAATAENEIASPMTPLFYDSLDDKKFTQFLLKSAQDYASAHGINKEGEAQNVSADNTEKAKEGEQPKSAANENDKNAKTAKRKSDRVSNERELISFVSANTNMSEDQAKQFVKDNKDAIAQAQNDSEQAWAQANAPALARADEVRKDASGMAWTMFFLAMLSLAASLAGASFGFEQFKTEDVAGEDDEVPPSTNPA